MRAGPLQLLGDRGQSFSAVDQYVDGVARTGLGVSGCPSAGRRVECMFPADSLQAPLMVRADLLADLAPEPAFGIEQDVPCSR
jgi:hypothetical protein